MMKSNTIFRACAVVITLETQNAREEKTGLPNLYSFKKNAVYFIKSRLQIVEQMSLR